MVAESFQVDSPFERVVQGLVSEGYAVIDDFLNAKEAARLQAFSATLFEEGQFKKAGVGRQENYQLNGAVRGDYIRWIDRTVLDPGSQFFLDRIEELVSYLNRTCFLGIRDQEMHFAIYPQGTQYQRHLDVFRQSQARKVSVVCYLNTDWKEEHGGCLRLFLTGPNGEEVVKDILPLGGRMVCFLSDAIEHAVLPATRERNSITGWLKDGVDLL